MSWFQFHTTNPIQLTSLVPPQGAYKPNVYMYVTRNTYIANTRPWWSVDFIPFLLVPASVVYFIWLCPFPVSPTG